MADLTASPIDSWMTLLLQGGALAILAYHFLVGLPKLIRDMAEANERTSDKQQAAQDRRADRQSELLKENSAAVKEQTIVLGKKLDEIKIETCKYRGV